MESKESWKQRENTLEHPKANPHFSMQESISQSNEPCTSWNQKKGCLHKKSKTSSRNLYARTDNVSGQRKPNRI